MTETSPELQRFLGLIELDRLDRDLYLGSPGQGEGRLFGGLVAAQAVVAAYRTVDEGSLHSLHAYFLRPGNHADPIRYVVYRIRDGRTFTSRDVVAYQSGEAIFSLSSSFTRPEEGISSQELAPEAPEPEGLPEWEFARSDAHLPEEREMVMRWIRNRPVDVRACDPPDALPGSPPHRRVWMRPRGVLPEDPVAHVALLAYASDHGLMATARYAHSIGRGAPSSASLDHAIWFHRPPRFDDWLLYTSSSPVAHAARALVIGQMHNRQGVHVATVAQEGLIRTPRAAS